MPKKLSQETIEAELTGLLSAWRLADGALERTYRCNGWRSAVMLFNGIAHLAEAAWHHPDICVGWGRVKIALSTHAVDGVTRRDLALAREIERLALWRPEPDTELEGPPGEGCWRYLEEP